MSLTFICAVMRLIDVRSVHLLSFRTWYQKRSAFQKYSKTWLQYLRGGPLCPLSSAETVPFFAVRTNFDEQADWRYTFPGVAPAIITTWEVEQKKEIRYYIRADKRFDNFLSYLVWVSELAIFKIYTSMLTSYIANKKQRLLWRQSQPMESPLSICLQ